MKSKNSNGFDYPLIYILFTFLCQLVKSQKKQILKGLPVYKAKDKNICKL